MPTDDSRATRKYTAAGGVIVEPDGQRVLVLLRPGRPGPSGRSEIRLPKGHIKPGESHRQAALREVSEEAGLLEVEVLDDLGHQIVEFDWQDAHHIRTEHYFLMVAPNPARGGEPEEQFQPLWLRWDIALDDLTYEAEREWLRRACMAWEQRAEGP